MKRNDHRPAQFNPVGGVPVVRAYFAYSAYSTHRSKAISKNSWRILPSYGRG